MATYNGGRFLTQQFESLRLQRRLPDELVVSDDGSSDDTVGVVEQFARTSPFPVRLVVNERRLGYNENFLSTFGRCRCDLVALADQDDYWHPDKIAVAVRAFADRRVVGFGHDVWIADEALRPTGTATPGLKRSVMNGDVKSIDPWITYGGMQTVYRRSAIAPFVSHSRPTSKWFPAPAAFDEYLVFLATVLGRFARSRKVLGLWRRHANAASSVSPGVSASEALGEEFQRRLAWKAGSANYERMAGICRSRAEFIRTIHRRISPAESVYRRLAETFDRRATLYQGGRPLLLLGMVVRGDYRSRDRGGLGVRSLAKDLIRCAWPGRFHRS